MLERLNPRLVVSFYVYGTRGSERSEISCDAEIEGFQREEGHLFVFI